jgi:hypothetical protein
MPNSYSKSTQSGGEIPNLRRVDFSGAKAYDQVFPDMTYTKERWTDSVSGARNPNWRSQVARGVGATTAMSGNRKTIKAASSVALFHRGNVNSPPTELGRRSQFIVGCISANPWTIPGTPTISHTATANQAAGTWYSKAADKISPFKAQIFAGESREARNMMADRSKKILGMIPGFQAGVKRRWYGKGTKRSRLKMLADSWLELQYGWLPLASDIEDANYVLNNPVPLTKYVKGEGFNEVKSTILEATGTTGDWAFRHRVIETQSCYVKFYGVVQAREDPSGSKLKDFGLSTREFLPTAWELLPWSFLIDYFTNVGQIVNAASYATIRKNWLSQCIRKTRSYKSNTSDFTLNVNYPAEELKSAIPDNFEAESSSVQRIPIGDVPFPTLAFSIPNKKQFINMAALAISRRLRLFHI